MRCIAPFLKHRPVRTVVPCGKCNYCLQTKRADWSFRLIQELRNSRSAYFLTLTYAEENLPVSDLHNATLVPKHVQDFIKRMREMQEYGSIRYYAVGEYGTKTQRPHYHAVVFGMRQDVHAKLPKLWPKGGVHTGTVTEASIHYVTKYVINRVEEGATCPVMKALKAREPPFALMSRRPGLGSCYLTPAMIEYHRGGTEINTDQDYTHFKYYGRNGEYVTRLPRFYKDRLFTPRERDYLSKLSVLDSDIAYSQAVEKFKQFHDDPYAYYDERLRSGHDAVHSKLNSNDHF